ncbi:MAG TPA: hypothetical protein VEP50_09490 [bacterium]|nr:hypothetical protein [bacterium]
MMKSVTIGLGAMTALAVIATGTPSGQAMLGMRPPADVPAVSVIPDTPPLAPSRPAPVMARVAPRAPVAAHPRPARVTPSAATVARASAPVGKAGTGQGLGSIASIADLLLNLPQEVSQASRRHVVPPAAPSEDDPPWAPRWTGTGHHGDPDYAPGETSRN